MQPPNNAASNPGGGEPFDRCRQVTFCPAPMCVRQLRWRARVPFHARSSTLRRDPYALPGDPYVPNPANGRWDDRTSFQLKGSRRLGPRPVRRSSVNLLHVVGSTKYRPNRE